MVRAHMTQETTQKTQPLRWGFSTGASMCAVALAAWLEHFHRAPSPLSSVPVEFLDGRLRHIPLFAEKIHGMVAVKKDGGDDPDCTHGALFYGNIRTAELHEAQDKDYILHIGAATLIVHALDGVGVCTRLGLDCQQGKWAINTGPREMLIKNLQKNGMDCGVWLFSFGVVDGLKRAKHSLNAHLGIEGGISILGTTGLVRPFSHDAYVATIHICVRSHHQEGGSSMVFCTGGRTQKGAKKYLPALPDSAFTCIADFIAVSIRSACAYNMQEITIACMPGKLCKYAAGFENTHAHKAQQDMRILRAAVQKHLPEAAQLHSALADSVTIREALLSIPEHARLDILHQLAKQALVQLASFATIATQLRVLVFDFQGDFLFEKSIAVPKPVESSPARPSSLQEDVSTPSSSQAQRHCQITEAHIGAEYFLCKEQAPCTN